MAEVDYIIDIEDVKPYQKRIIARLVKVMLCVEKFDVVDAQFRDLILALL